MASIPKQSTSLSSTGDKDQDLLDAELKNRAANWHSFNGFGLRHKEKTVRECSGHSKWMEAYKTADDKLARGGIICLIGPRGTGKTQLAYYLVKAFFRKNSASMWRYRDIDNKAYWTALDFFMAIKNTYDKNDVSEIDIIKGISRFPILVIDEIQVRSETAWENSMITHMIDNRYRSMNNTILISNQTKSAFIDSVGSSIADRIRETGGIIEMKWKSFRG